MCRALEVTRQGFYQWLARPESVHDIRDCELTKLISDEYEASRHIYGVPKLHMRLMAAGIHTSRKRIARLMRQNGWKGVTRACAKRPTGEKRTSKSESAEDLIKRNFKADGPNKAWFADITYVKTRQGWLYLAVVIDIWSRMAVGWSISSPWDNAPTESFMGIIKSECVHARTFDDREQAAIEIFDYIECFYNKLRIHSALGWLSPVEFEKKYEMEGRSDAA